MDDDGYGKGCERPEKHRIVKTHHGKSKQSTGIRTRIFQPMW
jgi:hypothetical protein